MKKIFYPLYFFVIIFLYENSAYSISENLIKESCRRKARRATCIKDLKFKKFNLLKGNKIEIPVIPFKK